MSVGVFDDTGHCPGKSSPNLKIFESGKNFVHPPLNKKTTNNFSNEGETMKQLMMTVLMLVGSSAFAWTPTGHHIHFQSASTWVSVFNSSNGLCLDGDMFRAKITKCAKYNNDDRQNVCKEKVTAWYTQPVASTRTICVDERGESGTCYEYATVPYVQSPDRTVVWEADRGGATRTETVRVPDCN